MRNQNEEDQNWGKIVMELALQLLKARYVKKKNKKAINPLEELTRAPSLNPKDPKKMIAAQTKSIYGSLNEYYRELMSKNHFDKECLNTLKLLDEELFQRLFWDIMKNEA